MVLTRVLHFEVESIQPKLSSRGNKNNFFSLCCKKCVFLHCEMYKEL